MKKVIGWLVFLCAAAVAGLGIWALSQPSRSYHVTGCGIAAAGPYAKVSVTNRTLGLGRKHVQFAVSFRYGGRRYGYGEGSVRVHALGSVTAVVRASPYTDDAKHRLAPIDPSKLTCTFIPATDEDPNVGHPQAQGS